MHRFSALAVMCLGLLAACSPPESETPRSLGSSPQELSPVPMTRTISITGAPLNFGNRKKGTSTSKTVTLSNSGTQVLTVSSIVPSDSSYTVSPTSTTLAANGGMQVVTVWFAPASTGQRQGIITVTSNADTNSTLTFGVDGFGVDSAADLSTTSISFGEAMVNGPGVDKLLTVTNVGAATLNITPSLAGASSSLFTVAPATASIPVGGSTTFTVKFRPTVVGTASANLNFTTDEIPAATPSPVALTGTGVQPTISVTPALAFADQQINTSGSALLPVTNTGSGTLEVTNIVKSGTGAAAYTFTPTTLSIPAQETRTVTVTFSPTATGTSNASLTLASNDATAPSKTVTLSGRGINPTISVPSTLAFGDVQKNTSMQKKLTVMNTGLGDLNVTMTKSGTDQAAYTFTPTTLTIPEGASQDVTVNFSPTATGAATATLTLASNDVTTPSKTVTLSGRGVNPTISVPSSLAFGDVQKNTSTQKTLTVMNTGLGVLSITLTKSGTGQSAYTFTPTTLSIPEGASQDVTVTFSPTATGAATATLTLSSNDVTTPSKTVTLSGRGINPTISVPGTLAFGDVQKNTSTQKTLTVMNTGLGTLSITLTKSGTGQSAYTFTPTTLSIPEGASQNVTVTFSPAAVGSFDAVLTLASNDVGAPSKTVALSGRGINPTISVPSSLAFGNQPVNTSGQRTLTVSNTGTGMLDITSIVKSGPGAPAYGFTPSTLSVPEGESRTLTVTFTPTVEGAVNAALTLTSNSATNPTVTISLSGTGLPPPDLQVSPAQLDLGTALVGSTTVPRTLSLRNAGNSPLTVSGLTLGGTDAAAFTLVAPTLPVVVQPGNQVDVSLSLRPDAVRQFSAVLQVSSDDPDSPSISVPLSGAGVAQEISLSDSSLEFGQHLVSRTSSPRKVRVINASDASVTLATLTVEGEGAAQFALAPLSLPLVLGVGQEKELALTFTPAAQGEVSGKLKVGFSNPDRVLEATLHGRGIPVVLSLSPSPLDFGTVRAGGKRELNLTVTNLTSERVVLAAPEVTSSTGESFLFDAESLRGRTLGPDMSTPLKVSYQPRSEGSSEMTLFFGTTAPAQLQATSVSLKGRAAKRVLVIDPESLDFSQLDDGQPAAPQDVTVTNTSSQEQRVAVKLRDSEGTSFSVDAAALAEALPPGASATFKVAFQPGSEGVARNEVQVWLQDASEPEGVIPVTGFFQLAGCGCGSAESGGSGLLALAVLMGLSSWRRRSSGTA